MPSGASPRHIFTCPEEWGKEYCGIPLCADGEDQGQLDEMIEEYRSSLEYSWHECMQWVDEEFEIAARQVYAEIGEPDLTPLTAWGIFVKMLPSLKAFFEQSN